VRKRATVSGREKNDLINEFMMLMYLVLIKVKDFENILPVEGLISKLADRM